MRLRNVLAAGAAAMIAGAARTRFSRVAAEPTTQNLRIQIDFDGGTAFSDGAGRGTTEDWIAMVRREVDELAAFADHLYAMVDLANHEAEVTEEAFVRLDDLRWLLGNYVLNGGRVRRLRQLPDLLKSIAVIDQRDVVGAVRCTGADLLRGIRRTNSVTTEWLIAHRVALPDPDHLDSNALLGRYDRLQLEPTSVSGDPLYLLTRHVHDVLETVDSLDDIDHPMLDILETQLAGVLTAVENEVTTAQAFNAALISLVRESVG